MDFQLSILGCWLGFVLCYGQSTFRVRIRVMVEFRVWVENTFWVMVVGI